MKKLFLKSNNKDFTSTLSFKDKENWASGFTLIELLVVIAIIGILSSVVITSLNSAREKSKIASIKSTLKNMITEAELYYSNNGNYSSATNGNLDKFFSSITTNNGTVKYYTHDGTRWGVSVKMNSDNTKNYSVNQQGVVEWDNVNTGTTMNWNTAVSSCASTGGRLPSIEEIKALWDAHGVTPPNFVGTYYWSGTLRPTNSNLVYIINMTNGSIYGPDVGRSNTYYVRCVR